MNIGGFIIVFVVVIGVLKRAALSVSPLNKFDRALNKVKAVYGLGIARNIERIYRLETANFTSKQFLETYSAGMEDHSSSNKYPYGWRLGGFWDTQTGRKYRPIGTAIFKEGAGLYNDGRQYKRFLKFPNVESAVMTLAEFLRLYDNNGGRWFSTEIEKQFAYNNRLQQIKTLYT